MLFEQVSALLFGYVYVWTIKSIWANSNSNFINGSWRNGVWGSIQVFIQHSLSALPYLIFVTFSVTVEIILPYSYRKMFFEHILVCIFYFYNLNLFIVINNIIIKHRWLPEVLFQLNGFVIHTLYLGGFNII